MSSRKINKIGDKYKTVVTHSRRVNERLALGCIWERTRYNAENMGVGCRDTNKRGEENNLLLATYKWGNNVWQEAAQEGILDLLQKSWEWAEENLTTENLNNKLLLHLDVEGRTVWHLAAYGQSRCNAENVRVG